MIFMVLNFVLENYFKDILSLVDQSSNIGDKILDCWFLSFNIFFYGLFRLNRLLLLMILGRYIYVFTCLCAWIYALCHLPCACALHAMLVCLGLDLFVMPCAITIVLFLLLHFLVFWPFGSDSIQALWSLSLSIQLGPYQRVWITHFSCVYLIASMFYACVSLSCSRLCHVWRSQRVHGCVVTFDANEALFGCSHLGCIAMMPVASCTPIPFFALLTILFLCHPLALCSSLHICLHVHA